MTAATATHKPYVSDETDGLLRAACSCGWAHTKATANRGAAVFTANSHAKRENGAVRDPNAEATEAEALATLRAVLSATPLVHTLPATLVRVPTDEYRVTRFRSLKHHRGIAFTASLEHRVPTGWRKIADIEDEGYGGSLRVEFIDGEPIETENIKGRRPSFLMEEYGSLPVHVLRDGKDEGPAQAGVNYYATPEHIAFVAWAGRTPGEHSDEYGTVAWTPYLVLQALITEAELAASLNRARTRTAVLRPTDDPRKGYLTVNTRDIARVVRYVEANADLSGSLVWTEGAWRTISDLK